MEGITSHPLVTIRSPEAGAYSGARPQTGPKKRRSKVPTVIHVNMHVIKSNRVHNTNEPPLTVRRGRRGKNAQRAHEVTINGPSKVIHSPHDPLPCGARVWIETFAEVTTT